MIERYRLEHRPGGQWVYVHAGTFERPAGERNFTAVFSGGCATGSLRWRTTPRLRILFQLRDRHAGAW